MDELAQLIRELLASGQFGILIIGLGIAIGGTLWINWLQRQTVTRVQQQFDIVLKTNEELRKEIDRLRKELERLSSNQAKLGNEIIEEISTRRSLRDSGVIRFYRNREVALQEFSLSIDSEPREIMIVGTSLKGLLVREQNKVVADKLRLKMDKGGVRIRFLLTHPVVADLRAHQEARQFTDIGQEIIISLLILKEWKVPPENVRLYKGSPTCFGIKTSTRMLLNPYPYGETAYHSPCLIVETSQDYPSYFYEAFSKSHFGAWDSQAAIKIFDFDEAINELRSNLDTYADLVAKILLE
jgi:hypothetical protein